MQYLIVSGTFPAVNLRNGFSKIRFCRCLALVLVFLSCEKILKGTPPKTRKGPSLIYRQSFPTNFCLWLEDAKRWPFSQFKHSLLSRPNDHPFYHSTCRFITDIATLRKQQSLKINMEVAPQVNSISNATKLPKSDDGNLDKIPKNQFETPPTLKIIPEWSDAMQHFCVSKWCERWDTHDTDLVSSVPPLGLAPSLASKETCPFQDYMTSPSYFFGEHEPGPKDLFDITGRDGVSQQDVFSSSCSPDDVNRSSELPPADHHEPVGIYPEDTDTIQTDQHQVL